MKDDNIEKSEGQFIFWSESFKSSLRNVLVSLRDRKRFVAVSGEKGFGKTEMFNLLGEGLIDAGYDVQTLDIAGSYASSELLMLLCSKLDVILENQTKLNLLQLLREYYQQNAKMSESLLLIDNCNRLADEEFFEDLKHISRYARELQIVMFGEPEYLSNFNAVFSLFNDDIEVVRLEGMQEDECTGFIGWLGNLIYNDKKFLPNWVVRFIIDTGKFNPGKIKLLTKIALEQRSEKGGNLKESDIQECWEFFEKF